MVSIVSTSKAQEQITAHIKALRLSKGLTQSGLAKRSGVSLPTLRKFEQKGLISLESFLKLCMSLGCLEDVVKALEPKGNGFASIDDVLKEKKDKKPQRGWLK